MAFIQIIEFRTSRFDEGRPHVEEYLAKTEGRRTACRLVLCRDRDDANHYVNIVYFYLYESAVENSNLPETTELASRLSELSDEPQRFVNLEVMEEHE